MKEIIIKDLKKYHDQSNIFEWKIVILASYNFTMYTKKIIDDFLCNLIRNKPSEMIVVWKWAKCVEDSIDQIIVWINIESGIKIFFPTSSNENMKELQDEIDIIRDSDQILLVKI